MESMLSGNNYNAQHEDKIGEVDVGASWKDAGTRQFRLMFLWGAWQDLTVILLMIADVASFNCDIKTEMFLWGAWQDLAVILLMIAAVASLAHGTKMEAVSISVWAADILKFIPYQLIIAALFIYFMTRVSSGRGLQVDFSNGTRPVQSGPNSYQHH